MIKIKCSYCGYVGEKLVGEVNRARKKGLNIYCNRKCAGLGRRRDITEDEFKENKRIYDIEFRKKNAARLKKEKSDYFQRTYDPTLAALHRAKYKKEKPYIEKRRRKYMASKKIKSLKKKYDRRYTAKQLYGEEWGECMALALDVRDECLNQMSDYEIRLQAGTLSKNQQRRKEYDRLNSNKSKIGALGHAG